MRSAFTYKRAEGNYLFRMINERFKFDHIDDSKAFAAAEKSACPRDKMRDI